MPSQPLAIFICYASKDAEHKGRLLVHLQGLVKQGIIWVWHDGLILPGQQWDEEIVRNLKQCRAIALLVSPDLIASDYVERVEKALAAELHAQGRISIIPVLVEHAHAWRRERLGDLTLGDLQALPDGGRFVVDWENVNQAWENVIKGIERLVVTPPEPGSPTDWRVHIPDPPVVGVVPRRDRKGRDIVGHLVEVLAPGGAGRVMLTGPGGIGKKTLAAEAARRLLHDYGGRVVWSDAEGRVQYTDYSLFEDISVKLGGSKPHRSPFDRKPLDAEKLIAGRPVLVVIDNFEAVRPAERGRIQRWLAGSSCSALFVSREIDERLDLHGVQVETMWPDEALELLRRLIEETQSPELFTGAVRDGIRHAAGGFPLYMKIIVAHIKMTQRPGGVFGELEQAKGDLANLIFELTFNLRQLGADGRAALLALSLFTPRATHEALAHVAGFGRGPRALRRLDKAVANLTRLSLLKAGDRSGRLGLENLVRRLARAKLREDTRAGRFRWLPGAARPLFVWFLTREGRGRHLKRRFVEYFRAHALNFDWDAYAERTVPEAERSNVVAAMQLACERQDWDTVLELFAVTLNYIDTYTVWRKSIVAAERQAGDRLLKTGRRPPLLIEINHRRENKRAARRYYEVIPERLGGVPGVASHADLIGFEPAHAKLPREEWWRLVVLSVAAFELGVCAHSRGRYEPARGYFEAAKRLKLAFGDHGGYGIACNGLGVTLAVEGLAGKGSAGWKAVARAQFEEARAKFAEQRGEEEKKQLKKPQEEQRWEEARKFEQFEKVAERNKEWVGSLED